VQSEQGEDESGQALVENVVVYKRKAKTAAFRSIEPSSPRDLQIPGGGVLNLRVGRRREDRTPTTYVDGKKSDKGELFWVPKGEDLDSLNSKIRGGL